MKITDALLGEHAMLYALFSQIRRQFAEQRSIEQVRVTLEILEDQLWNHAQMEEKHLFPALEKHLGQRGPLAVMKSEHQDIDRLLEAAKSTDDLNLLKSHMEDMIDLAYAHFQKEEMVLFTMAKQFLSEADQESLGDVWATERAVTINGTGCPSQQAAAG
jgi:iron-sulfur cluster repair protein YtfE (RIC family)